MGDFCTKPGEIGMPPRSQDFPPIPVHAVRIQSPKNAPCPVRMAKIIRQEYDSESAVVDSRCPQQATQNHPQLIYQKTTSFDFHFAKTSKHSSLFQCIQNRRTDTFILNRESHSFLTRRYIQAPVRARRNVGSHSAGREPDSEFKDRDTDAWSLSRPCASLRSTGFRSARPWKSSRKTAPISL